jgi:hypothetical protein
MLEVASAILHERMFRFPGTGGGAGIAETGGHGVPLTLSTRQELISGMNLCVGLYHAYDSLDMTVVGQRIGTYDVETCFGMVRSVLAGHCQFRFWESAEASIGLMNEYGGRLGLQMRQRRGRLSAAGTPAPRVDARDALPRLTDGDEPLCALLASAREFPCGPEDLLDEESLIGACLLDRVEWLSADSHRLAAPEPPVPHAGLTCNARRYLR